MLRSRIQARPRAAAALAFAAHFALATGVAAQAPATPATPPSPATPVIVDGQAQVVPAFADSASWIRHDLWVETAFDSDGDGRPDRVHVAVTRPRQTETDGLRVPVIYETSPYFAGTGPPDLQYFWNVEHEIGAVPPPREPMPSIPQQRLRPRLAASLVRTWVPRGFAVVHSSSPGTGLSQGCPTVGGENEALAPKAVIDWLNGRARGFSEPEGGVEVVASWANGRVGMTGTSYNGTLPLAAASTGVDGLDAIIPVAPNTSYYHYFRSHGLVRSPGGWLGEDIDVLYDFINSGNPERRAFCNATIRDGEMAANMDRVTGDYNDFWAGRDYLHTMRNVRAAVLMAHAFNDWNVMPEHGVRIYEALRAQGTPVRLYMHQGGHGGAPPLEMMNRWFTRFLHDVDNGVEAEARAWIVREADDRMRPTAYADYPHPDATPVLLHPRAGGRGIGALAAARTGGQGLESITDDVAFDGAAHARALTSEHRLLYATDVLDAPLHVSGTPQITLRVAVGNRSAANLSVWLVSLPWNDDARLITDNIITRGWADPRNAGSLRNSQPLAPGEFRTLTFTLQPDDQVIPAGARIGLMLFSSDPEFTLWPAAGTELTFDLDATVLQLPVVGGAGALRRALGGS